MTLREELEKALMQYGLNEQEAIIVVEQVKRISEETDDSEVKGHWDEGFGDLVAPGRHKNGYTPEELKTFQDAVFSALWSITKIQVRYILYASMETLAELIIKFK